MLRRRLIGAPLAGCLLGRLGTAGAAPPPVGISARPLTFPADFGAHPETRIEWWYVTGWLAAEQAAQTPRFGFQLTLFRLRTGVAADHPSRFAATQLIFAHAALSDLAARELRHDQRTARSGFGIAEATIGDTDVRLRDWRLQRSGPTARSRYRAQVSSDTAGFALDLQLETTQDLLLQGVAGLSRKGPNPAQASHYYSQPQLQASGLLTLRGAALPVRGKAWLDHEWSDSLLDAAAVGWDWIGINLDDGSALTAFRLRRADGSSVYAGGSWRAQAGSSRSFVASEVAFDAGRRWTSPRTQASYPVEWQVTTPVGRFRVDAAFDDQELDSRSSTGAVYWEGLATLRDADGRLAGRGYLEMTGYAGRLQF